MFESGNVPRTSRSSWNRVLGFVSMCALAFLHLGDRFWPVSHRHVTGTITDPKGLAMVGVNVLIHNVDTGVDQRP